MLGFCDAVFQRTPCSNPGAAQHVLCLLPGLDAGRLRLFSAHLLPEGDLRGLPRRRQAGRRGHLLDAGDASRRRPPVWRDGGTIRPPAHADAQRRRLLRLRAGQRLRAHAAQLSGLPGSVRRRHGRRVGRGRRARPGDAPRPGARLLLRPAAGRLRGRQPAGRRVIRPALSPPARHRHEHKLARAVHGWSAARAARLLFAVQG